MSISSFFLKIDFWCDFGHFLTSSSSKTWTHGISAIAASVGTCPAGPDGAAPAPPAPASSSSVSSSSGGAVKYGMRPRCSRRGRCEPRCRCPKTSEKSNKSDKKTTHIVEIPCEIPWNALKSVETPQVSQDKQDSLIRMFNIVQSSHATESAINAFSQKK